MRGPTGCPLSDLPTRMKLSPDASPAGHTLPRLLLIVRGEVFRQNFFHFWTRLRTHMHTLQGKFEVRLAVNSHSIKREFLKLSNKVRGAKRKVQTDASVHAAQDVYACCRPMRAGTTTWGRASKALPGGDFTRHKMGDSSWSSDGLSLFTHGKLPGHTDEKSKLAG